MTLTSGRGPLTSNPAGRFVPPLPGPVAYIEPFRRRVEGRRAGVTVVDSERVVLVHRPGQPPSYAFPAEDVGAVPSTPTAELAGYVEVAWAAVDEWREEGEQVHLHVRNPYHRIDVARGRHLRVELAGRCVVDTAATVVLYETSLEPRLYVAPSEVRDVELVASTTTTYCPYKGTASYWSAVLGAGTADEVRVEDVAWSYEDPLPESTPIAGLVSFDPARAAVEHDVPPPAI